MKDIFVNKKETAIFKNKKIKTKILMEQDVHYQVQLQRIMDVEKHLKKSCELAIKYVNNAIKI